MWVVERGHSSDVLNSTVCKNSYFVDSQYDMVHKAISHAALFNFAIIVQC